MKYYAVKGRDVFGKLTDIPYDQDFYFFPCKIIQVLPNDQVEIKYTHPVTASLVHVKVNKGKVIDIDVKTLLT